MQREGIRPSRSIAHFQPGLSQPLALPSEAKHTSTRHQFPVQGSCFRPGVQAAPPSACWASGGHHHPGCRCLSLPGGATAGHCPGAAGSSHLSEEDLAGSPGGEGWRRVELAAPGPAEQPPMYLHRQRRASPSSAWLRSPRCLRPLGSHPRSPRRPHRSRPCSLALSGLPSTRDRSERRPPWFSHIPRPAQNRICPPPGPVPVPRG